MKHKMNKASLFKMLNAEQRRGPFIAYRTTNKYFEYNMHIWFLSFSLQMKQIGSIPLPLFIFTDRVICNRQNELHPFFWAQTLVFWIWMKFVRVPVTLTQFNFLMFRWMLSIPHLDRNFIYSIKLCPTDSQIHYYYYHIQALRWKTTV